MAGALETMQDRQFVQRLRDELATNGNLVLCTVHDNRGSMPRHAGARMALLANGEFIGTVGGGHIEQMSEDLARAYQAAGEGSSIEWNTHQKNGMACGGDAFVSVTTVTPELVPLLDQLIDALDQERSVYWQEDWSDPAHPAYAVIENQKKLAVDLPYGFAGQAFVEPAQVYVEAVFAIPHVYIFGAGHVGRALCPVVSSIGFIPVVLDIRPEYATPERFPLAEKIVVGENYPDLAESAPITEQDYVVVTTHGHVGDIDVLEHVLPKHPLYVGCIGSRTKRGFVERTLVEYGIPASDAERVFLPIGDAIKASTPPEIAISIAAQLIRFRAEHSRI
jgi:xanthine dehydrogenase accessory factor